MTPAESLFIVTTSILFLISIIFVKNFPWKKLGFMPESAFRGWWQVLSFNLSIFTLVQLALFYKFIEFPAWMVDKDPILGLIVIGFLQELIFRGVVISWLERWSRKKALWFSTIVFVLLHLAAPYMWNTEGVVFAGLTFIAGYFWGWHFLKFRNIYLISVSHFLVNLGFNFLIFNLF